MRWRYFWVLAHNVICDNASQMVLVCVCEFAGFLAAFTKYSFCDTIRSIKSVHFENIRAQDIVVFIVKKSK